MKTFNKYIAGLAAAIALLGATSCQDDFDGKTPAKEIPVATLTPNTTILEVKTEFWKNEVNYIDTIRTKADGSHYIISGRVLSSDRSGNVYKKLVIQDETAALAFSINKSSLYCDYRVGQEIVVDLTGMYIGKYNGMQQIGYPDFYEKTGVWEATFLPYEMFAAHVQLNGLPDPSKIYTVTKKISELPTDPAQLAELQSQLVRFNNVYFEDGGNRAFCNGYKENTNRILKDDKGNSITVRTSGYATFRDEILPEGYGDVIAILDYYATSEDAESPWQLTLINSDDCINFGNPTMEPGDRENPYTVAQLIDLELAENRTTAWVTGYIVGAVAGGVTEITSNDDIEFTADVTLENNIVIADDPDCTDFDKCVVIPIPADTPLRQYGNLSENPGNYKKQIWIKGTFDKYMGIWGLVNTSGAADTWAIDGVETPGSEAPEGTGTETAPYNVAQIIALNPTATDKSPEGGAGIWVKGYIVGSMSTSGSSTTLAGTTFGTADPATTNIVLGPTPDCTDYKLCIGIQLPTEANAPGIRSSLNLADNPGMLGAQVMLFGDVMKYCGGPGIKNTSKVKILTPGTGTPDTPDQPDTPDTPDTPSADEQGDGTLASPYNVARANAIIAAGSYTADNIYLQGIVSQIKEIDTGTYGNATYYISDDGTTAGQLMVYRGYYLNGEKFTSTDQLKVGDRVIILGALTNYNGTYEVTMRSQLVSINGQPTQ